MKHTLLIGQRSYSSWSLRGWLPFGAFDLPLQVENAVIYSEGFHDQVARFGGHRTVPVLRCPDGGVLTESIAIAWHMAETFPDTPLLPADPILRAQAISMIAEMHSGFAALRAACPMNLRTGWAGFKPDEDVLTDLARLDTLLGGALTQSGGPFLFGDYTLADAYYAPVATRIATYSLPVCKALQDYVAAHLAHGPLRRWRAMGATEGPDLEQYAMPLERVPYPAPEPIQARAVDAGTPENAACPYSGRPVTHFMETGGRIFGFCNAFCRDKTVADPEAWPAFIALLNGSRA